MCTQEQVVLADTFPSIRSKLVRTNFQDFPWDTSSPFPLHSHSRNMKLHKIMCANEMFEYEHLFYCLDSNAMRACSAIKERKQHFKNIPEPVQPLCVLVSTCPPVCSHPEEQTGVQAWQWGHRGASS